MKFQCTGTGVQPHRSRKKINLIMRMTVTLSIYSFPTATATLTAISFTKGVVFWVQPHKIMDWLVFTLAI